MDMNVARERLVALARATPNMWIALSGDETRVVAEADTFEAAVAAAEHGGEADPIILLVPEDWNPRVL